jgi:protoporphyrinogen oxidase
MSTKLSVAIIGGGITGLSAALRLAEGGHSVCVYEKQDHIGGLSDTYAWNETEWDRFYHVVLSTDLKLLELIDKLGLSSRLFWQETKSGFYGDGNLVSMSSIGDFLKFPFLSLWQKFRLGVGILSSTRLKDADRLDRIYVKEWLTKVFGRRVYERIWDPLLRSKLGDARNRTSAAFIWATINRLYGARSGDAKTERMGHVRGGYACILGELQTYLENRGVDIRLGKSVDAVTAADDAVIVRAEGTELIYDKALLTVSAPEVLRMCDKSAADGNYWRALEEVDYLGVICLFTVLDRGLSPYYVTNLLDKSLPFTGIIEVTNIIDPQYFGGKHLVYLPKYVTQEDPLLEESDELITEKLLAGLKKVHPDLSSDSILHTKLFKERYVQPLQEVNYLDKERALVTPLPNVYLANSTLLYNSTLNNNAAIGLAERAAAAMTEKSAEAAIDE